MIMQDSRWLLTENVEEELTLENYSHSLRDTFIWLDYSRIRAPLR